MRTLGIEWIEKTVEALQQAGIRAQRGFPAGKMPYLTAPIAGVSVEQIKDGAMTVIVRVYAPTNQGGPVCEDTAVLVMQTLTQLQGQCSMGSCEFNGKTGLFCLPVHASFVQEDASPTVEVYINDVLVPNVISVSTEYQADLDRYVNTQLNAPYFSVSDNRWIVEVVDLIPYGEMPNYADDHFTLSIHYASGTHSYSGCFWQSVSAKPTAAGIRRVRKIASCYKPITELAE